MPKAIVVDQTGGPEVLQWREYDPGVTGAGQIRVSQEAIGLNFIDVYFRGGTYDVPSFPFIPGSEGAGTVIETGDGVTDFAPGDRVVYCGATGAYAEVILIEAAKAIRLPDSVDCETAAAIMLKGLTAEYLLRRTYKVGPDTVMLYHAAAGGVGLLACQWASVLGATVIGTAGSDAKCDLALSHGCDFAINYRENDFAAEVARITGGGLCDVVYDSVGRDTFPKSLDCLKKRGLWVSFGQSSGKVPPFDIGLLNTKGSLFATRPNLQGYNTTRKEFEDACAALFEVVAAGQVKIEINQRYSLADARKAHWDLEQRKTSGSSILLP